LSPGILDIFFRKYRIMCLFPKREFIYLKIAQIFNSTTHHILFVGGSSIPYLELGSIQSTPCTSLINELRSIQRKQYFFYTAISARCFNILLFESMGVS
jgi:hypothetical protein